MVDDLYTLRRTVAKKVNLAFGKFFLKRILVDDQRFGCCFRTSIAMVKRGVNLHSSGIDHWAKDAPRVAAHLVDGSLGKRLKAIDGYHRDS